MRPHAYLVLLGIAACTDGTRDARPSVVAPAATAPASAPAAKLVVKPPRRVEVNGLLIESEVGGPRLCVGGWEEMLPPRCGDLPVVGLDWAQVDGETRTHGTTWGEFHVVGDFDGETFTLTRPPGPPAPPPPADTTIPCSPPNGRWDRPNLELATFDQVYATDAAARRIPGYAGLWMRDLEPQDGEVQDMTKVVLVVAFTGDAMRHTAALREHWGGALCIVQRTRDAAELERIKGQALEFVTTLGLVGQSSDYDETSGLVRVEVLYADATHQAQMDRQYGPGVVVLESLLRPVAEP